MRVIANRSRARIWLWLDQRQARGAAATRASKSCNSYSQHTRGRGCAWGGRTDAKGRVGLRATAEEGRPRKGQTLCRRPGGRGSSYHGAGKACFKGRSDGWRSWKLRQRLSRRQRARAELEARSGSGGWRRRRLGCCWSGRTWSGTGSEPEAPDDARPLLCGDQEQANASVGELGQSGAGERLGGQRTTQCSRWSFERASLELPRWANLRPQGVAPGPNPWAGSSRALAVPSPALPIRLSMPAAAAVRLHRVRAAAAAALNRAAAHRTSLPGQQASDLDGSKQR